ncbi:MAG: apolipoprotein N-acyltransferase [Ruminococcaceae bacterium]|nr:apolipoprotein N-acyltransferase [Oscillospiraceae bacterium]
MKNNTFLKCLFSLFAGLLASLPLMLDSIPYLSFLLFVPYFLFLLSLKETVRLRLYYLSGLLFFLGYYMGAFSFFAAMYPLDFAGLGTGESIAVLFSAMVLLPLFQAWFSAFSILLLGLLKRRGALRFPLAFSLALASLYTLFAFAQNFTWAGVPWANTAVGLASSPVFLQSASLLGTSFLVFLIVFCNAAIAEGYVAFRDCRDKQALACVLCALLLFTSNLLFGFLRLASHEDGEDTITVAVLQGNAPATENTFVFAHLRTCRYEALEAAREADVDLMLWSESVLTYALQSDESAASFFSDIAVKTGAMQVVGAFSSEETPNGDEGYYNALFLFYPNGTMEEVTYKKRRPVPFGEYVPMPRLFETLIPALTEISMLSRNTTPGEDTALFRTEGGVFGGLICFDSIYPSLARESVKDGAELLLLSTDDSWFDGSFAKSLHFRHAVLRAVENGRAIVRTGNTGLSGAIDSYGNARVSVEPDEIGHGIITVAKAKETTVYTATGDVFPLVLFSFLLLLPFPWEKTKKR